MLIVFLSLNAFLLFDIYGPFKVNLEVETSSISNIYANQIVELVAKLNVDKNKDIYTDNINFISVEEAKIHYADNSTTEANLNIRNNHVFLNNKENVNLRLMLSNIDTRKEITGISFALLSSVSTYTDQQSSDKNYLFIPLNDLNVEIEDTQSFRLTELEKVNQLVELADLGAGKVNGYETAFDDNLLYILLDNQLKSVNLQTGEIIDVKSLYSIYSNNIDNTQDIMVNVNDEIHFISDLGFIATYQPSSDSLYKSSDVVKAVSSTRQIANYQNQVIASFDNILLYDKKQVQFDENIQDIFTNGDDLYIVLESKVILYDELNIEDTIISSSKLSGETYNVQIDSIEMIDGNGAIYATNSENQNIIKYNALFENPQNQNYKKITKGAVVESNSITILSTNQEFNVQTNEIIETNKGHFIIDTDNKLHFIK